MQIHPTRWALAVVFASCATSQPPVQSPPTEDPAENGAERKAYTGEECEELGGIVIGDIGNGAIHRPDYVCPSGKPPLGDYVPPKGGPIPVEGAVCCPR